MSGFGDEEEYRGTVTVVLPVTDGARPSEPSEPSSGAKGTTGAADAGGAAEEGVAVRVRAHLAGHFSPLTGDYRWRGRLSSSQEVTAAFREGVRTVVVRTPDGFEGTGVLDEPDLWGGHPVAGAGSPPFAVPHVDIDASDD
ncbi:DUF4873 domain-containing protein [Nocardiopsis sp. RV163]|uniref:DUF4873 domain-containing protein n=1 Tax=Nocardiopsis sp. RV163 TaxID=1661388 RepID=UPI00064C1F20|nr:DUF4873 domain-containing protein [Nocardiopsis sp. RV163]